VTGSTTTNTSSDQPSAFGFGLRFALPIQLAESKHISIQLAPYLQLAYAHSALQWADMAPDVTNTSHNYFRFEVGATAQAELQFGFLGAPRERGVIA